MDHSNSEADDASAATTGSPIASERYLNDLADIQTFLGQLQQIVAQTDSDAQRSDDFFLYQFADEYLAALRLKQRQLTGVRTHVRQTPSDPMSLLLSEMLDVIEPLCLNMIRILSGLRGKLPPKKAKKAKPMVLGSPGAAVAPVQEPATDSDLFAPVEHITLQHHPTVSVLDDASTTDIQQPSADFTYDAGDSQDSAIAEAAKSASDLSTVTGHVDMLPAPVPASSGLLIPTSEQQQQQSADLVATGGQLAPAVPVEPPAVADHLPELYASSAIQQVMATDDRTTQQLSEYDASNDEARGASKRTRQPASDDWIDIYAAVDGGQKGENPLEDWSYDWKQSINANKRGGTTKWTVDRHAPVSMPNSGEPPGRDQAQVQEFLMAIMDRYKYAKDHELMRDLMVTFDGMEGIDRGSLSREFFYLTFEACVSGTYKGTSLLEGERGRLLPRDDDNIVDAFKYLGMIIAHAVRHGCRGLHGLSPAIKYYLVYGQGLTFIEDACPPVSIDDVADEKLFHLLAKLEKGVNLTPSDNDLLLELMQHNGHRVQLTEHTRQLIVQKLLIDHVYKHRIRQLDAIIEGMEKFKLRSFLRDNPTKDNIARVFPSPKDVNIDPELFMAAIISRGDDFDPSALEFLRQFLGDLHAGNIENKSVSDLVQFVTGSPYVPERVIVSFNKSASHPVSHSCFSEIELPTTHRRYDSFRDAMVYALLHGMEFSRE